MAQVKYDPYKRMEEMEEEVTAIVQKYRAQSLSHTRMFYVLGRCATTLYRSLFGGKDVFHVRKVIDK